MTVEERILTCSEDIASEYSKLVKRAELQRGLYEIACYMGKEAGIGDWFSKNERTAAKTDAAIAHATSGVLNGTKELVPSTIEMITGMPAGLFGAAVGAGAGTLKGIYKGFKKGGLKGALSGAFNSGLDGLSGGFQKGYGIGSAVMKPISGTARWVQDHTIGIPLNKLIEANDRYKDKTKERFFNSITQNGRVPLDPNSAEGREWMKAMKQWNGIEGVAGMVPYLATGNMVMGATKAIGGAALKGLARAGAKASAGMATRMGGGAIAKGMQRASDAMGRYAKGVQPAAPVNAAAASGAADAAVEGAQAAAKNPSMMGRIGSLAGKAMMPLNYGMMGLQGYLGGAAYGMDEAREIMNNYNRGYL